eukprot:Nk52_evm62s2192 gene=Nk52_evmTU62s2192
MFIEEVVIDGFKSYAQRTVISGFDQKFNAITGLNGSGKSNILDAICFVLGITDMKQVRASHLGELVYKQGQAGVTKASVTIVFNNEDKTSSPIGYEKYDQITVTRQVVIGGRNKYLINGAVAQVKNVTNMFLSVQLNVNNPHFLIMQGRITKVLNMKPPETLSLIEEAAGTRMFENKKIAAQKTIEKKQKKLEEINCILQEEITPTLEKLRKERSSFLEYQKTKMELEHLSRFCTAHDFVEKEKLLKSSSEKLRVMDGDKKQMTTSLRAAEIEYKNISQNKEILEKKRTMQMGGAIKDLEKHVSELSKEVVKADSVWKHSKEALTEEKGSMRKMQSSLAENDELLAGKEQVLEKEKLELESLQKLSNSHQEELAQSQSRYDGVVVGVSSDDKESMTFGNQILDAQNRAAHASSEADQAKMKAKCLADGMKDLQKSCDEFKAEYDSLKEEICAKEKIMATTTDSINKLQFSPSLVSETKAAYQAKEKIVNSLKQESENLMGRLSSVNFAYKDPEPNFDRSKVRGLVAKLIKVNDPTYLRALEITAGGKLYNVIVENDVVGQKILEKGGLKRRVTILPLNKISSQMAPANAVALAKKEVGANNVNIALSLVGYDHEVEAAMKYVFGKTLICKDMESAKQVTFNKNINLKSVTLEGDVFDPSGTLTGGSKPSSSSVLQLLQELNNLQRQLKVEQAGLDSLAKNMCELKKVAAEHKQLSEKQGLTKHELELLEKRMKQNRFFIISSEIESTENEIQELEKHAVESTKLEAECLSKVKEIEKQKKLFSSQREVEMKKMEKELEAKKKMSEKSMSITKEKEQEVEGVHLEIGEIIKDKEALLKDIATSKATQDSLAKEVEKHYEVLLEKKETYDTVNSDYERKRAKLSAADKEISALAAECDKFSKVINESQLGLKKLEHQISKAEKDKKDCVRIRQKILDENDWILTEQKYFGEEDTAYDFNGKNIKEYQIKLAKMKEAHDKVCRNVNMKVANMFAKAEKEYEELKKKKQIVENDKDKIESAIDELDKKKKEALKKTYEKVNKDFSSIFSTLLPGTDAKLCKLEDQDLLDGLQIKVAFGKVWKESLTELSGGQRSLVALSLILSLLLFKPAPMYILDEVDAALDLSHTQNIGQMLRKHFSQSQFIVVSLKEGMFNNANVLFQTKFVDGVSTVERFGQHQPNKENEENEIEQVAAKQSKGKSTSRRGIRPLALS